MPAKWGNIGNWGAGSWGGVNSTGTQVAVQSGGSSPTVTYRVLDNNYDPIWGQGQDNFLFDLDAVAQAILTRINLFQAEWWADLQDGTPVWQKILGASGSTKNQQAISLILQKRILGTPFVSALRNVQASFDSSTRAFKFYAEVQTQFGMLSVANIPAPTPQGLP